jgi:hypothetical protein
MYNSRGTSGTGYWRHLYAKDLTISGTPLAPIATSASATDLRYGIVSVSLLPQIPKTKLSGNYVTGAFHCAVSPNSNDAFDLGGPTSNWRNAYVKALRMGGDATIAAGSPAGPVLLFSEADRTVSLSNASLSVAGAVYASGATLSAPLDMGSNSLHTTGSIGSGSNRAAAVYSTNTDATSVSVGSNLILGPGVTTSIGASMTPSSNFTVDIGAASNGWRTIYASNASLAWMLTANGVTVTAPVSVGCNGINTTGSISSSNEPSSAVYTNLLVASSANIHNGFSLLPTSVTSIGTDLVPDSNSIRTLGASNTIWSTMYASNASLTGSLIANGATLSAPLVLGSNSVTLTGSVASLSNRATAVFSQSNDANFASVNSNFTVQPGATTNFGTSLLPGSNDAFDIGASNTTWKNLYASNASLTGSLTANGATLFAPLVMGSNSVTLTGSVASSTNRATAIYSQSNDANFSSVNSNFTVQPGATTNFGTSLLPGSNDAFDIGASNTTWKNLYASNASLTGSLTANGATLAAPLVLGSNSVTLSGSVASSGSRATAVFSQSNDANFVSVNSNFTVQPGATTNFGTSLLPGSNGAHDIGSSNTIWKNVYASNASLTGSLTANGATLSAPLVMGSNSVTLTGSVASSTNRATAVFAQSNDANFANVNSNFTVQPGATTNFGTSLLPGSNDAFDIGSSAATWKDHYASNASLTGSLTANGATLCAPLVMGSNSVTLTGSVASSTNRATAVFSQSNDANFVSVNSNFTVQLGATTSFGTSLLPASSGAHDIGSSNTIWRNVHASNVSLSGTGNFAGSLTTTNIYPSVNNSHSIGTSSNFFQSICGSELVAKSFIQTPALYSTGFVGTNHLGVDGGSAVGIRYASTIDSTWQTYYASAGSLKSAANGISCASLDGRNAPALRTRVPNTTSNSVIWENSSETCLMSLAPDTGKLLVTGPFSCAGGITSSNGISVTSGSSTFAGTLTGSNGLTITAGTATFASNLAVAGPIVIAGGITSSNGLLVTSGSASFSGPLNASSGLTVTAGTTTFGSNLAVVGPFVTAGGITSSNGLSVTSGTSTFAGLVTASNGLTVAAGSTSFASNLTVLGPLVASNSIVGASFDTTGAMTAGSGSFAGNVTVNGDFSVGGRIDYISTSELMVADKHITLASSATPTDAGASGAGMYVQGSNYATSNSTISLTWNTGVNGNYWLTKGGNVALQGTSNSKMVTLSTSADGSLKLLSDDGVSAATTAAFGVPLVPASSTMDIGTSSSPWGTVYATSIGSASRLVPVFSSTLACTSFSGSTATLTGALTCTSIDTQGSIINTGSGSISGGPLSGTSATLTGTLTSRSINPASNNAYNLGSTGSYWNTFYVNNIFAGPISTQGSALTTGPIKPSTSNVHDIGSSTNAYSSAYFNDTLNVSAVSVSTGNFTGSITCKAVNTQGSNITSGHLLPTSTGAYDMGTASNDWRNAYLSGSLAAPSATITSLLTTTATLTGALACTTINTQGSNISAGSGAISGGAFTATSLTTGTGSISGSTGTFSGSVSTGAITASGAVNPNADSTLNLGASGTRWANVYANTLSATKYTGLPSKCWNAITQGTWGGPGGALYKIASVPSIGDAAGGGGVRITGSLGGFESYLGATIDCTISSRAGYFVKGSLHGFASGAKSSVDIVTYVETSGSFSVYIKVTGYYVTWDLSVQPAGINVNVYEPSSTNTTSPTGTLNTASVLSVLSAVTDTTTKATSFGNFSFTSNATDLTWAAQGTSVEGSIACGNLACANLTASGPSFSIGSLLGTSAVAGGPYIVSAGFDTVGTTHSIPIPPGGRNQAGILHIFAKNLNGNYGQSKSGYMKLYFSALEGDQNNTFGIVESYAPRITTFTAAGSGQQCIVTTDSDCCISWRYEGAV